MAPRRFHSGALWQKTRLLKLRMQPLCEECLRDGGKLQIACVVHHLADVSDRPDLAVALDNLESLCRAHHEHAHGRGEAPPTYSDAIDPQTGYFTDENHPSNKRPIVRGWRTRARR
jgi:5-methylcytosine-specific restriction protein A